MSMQQQTPIQFLHEGLTQKKIVYYTFEDGHRNAVEHPKRIASTTPFMRREIVFHLPLFMTSPVWKRYGYSLKNVEETLECHHTMHLYQLGLLHDISPSNSAVKVAFSKTDALVFSSKMIIIRKILSQVQQQHNFPTSSCLDSKRFDHVPALPLVHVSCNVLNKWKRHIPRNLVIMDGGHWDHAWKFRDIQLVPLWMEQGALLMNRIISKEVFDASGRNTDALSKQPIPVTVGKAHKEYYGVEEACFLVTDEAG